MHRIVNQFYYMISRCKRRKWRTSFRIISVNSWIIFSKNSSFQPKHIALVFDGNSLDSILRRSQVPLQMIRQKVKVRRDSLFLSSSHLDSLQLFSIVLLFFLLFGCRFRENRSLAHVQKTSLRSQCSDKTISFSFFRTALLIGRELFILCSETFQC